MSELDDMVNKGIIFPMGSEPSDWCHPLVVTPKPNGCIRLGVDFHVLNHHVKRPVYPLITPAEAVSRVKNAHFYTVYDATMGYWQIPFDETSHSLTVFMTPWGQFKYL